MSTACPRLRPDIAVIEQTYRGEQSFILKDRASKKYFRFRPVEAMVIRCFDGTRTAAQIVAGLAEHGLRVSAATVDGFARKLGSLGLMERSLDERTTLQLERLRAERRQRRRPALFRGELLRMRWSVGDPDRLFNRLLPAVRWCFTRTFLVVSVLLFAAYFVVLAATWGDFTRTVAALYSPSTLTLSTFVVLWITALTVIGVHELGHGFTCKYFGGEVHELGVMLLYFQLAFYCNVNDAWSFPELRARLWVTAAGSWIQFVLAGLAAILWWVAVPGTLASEVAVAAMLVGGMTTVITNLNPLIPLDGYFALSDYLDVPNLRVRAFAHLKWWIMRHVLRLEIPEPRATDRERRIFLVYAVLAAVYVSTIFLVIAGLVFGWAQQVLGALGALLVAVAVFAMVRHPLREWWQAAALSLRARRVDWRGSPAGRRIGAALLVAVLVAAVVPWPLTASGAFASAPALTLALTAPDSGVVSQVLVREGTRVDAGAPLVRLVDYGLERARAAGERAADSLALDERRARARGSDAVAERLVAERTAAAARSAALRSRSEAMTVRAPARGVVTTPRPEVLLGRRVEASDTLLAVSDLDSVEVRIALHGGGASLVRSGQPVTLFPYADAEHPLRATIASVSSGTGRTLGAATGNAAAGNVAAGVEARVRLPADAAWRPGLTGEASVVVGRSNLLGALWWGVRKRVRSDLLL